MSKNKFRVGIEVGGTFTDLIASDGDKIKTVKSPEHAFKP